MLDFLKPKKNKDLLKRYQEITWDPNHLEHSVVPSLDYPYAKEFYPENDERYLLVKEFENLILQTNGLRIFNCKIGRPTFLQVELADVFNVYVYFLDRAQAVGEGYNYLSSENEDYIELFKTALQKYPYGPAKDIPIQVFVEDFSLVAKSYAVSKAETELKQRLSEEYSGFSSLSYWDACPYIFLQSEASVEVFNNTASSEELKHICFEVIKKYDADDIWKYEDFRVRIDTQKHYDDYGGYQNYFNSDAMFENVML